MGASKKKREAFLVEHPFCCFCGATVPATTIDHIPARTCFRGRAFPETFEFPACQPSNSASRLDEIAFAFYVRMADQTEGNFEPDEATSVINGLVNNLPRLAPRRPDAMEARRGLRRLGLNRPIGAALSDLPLISVPPEAHAHLERYARKIAIALHYREKGHAASLDHRVTMEWGPQNDQSFRERAEGFYSLPHLEVGTRKNLEFGNQFAYRFVHADTPDVFASVILFGSGIALAGIVADSTTATRLLMDGVKQGLSPDCDPWIRVRDNNRNDDDQTH